MATITKYTPFKFYNVSPQLAGMACPGTRLKVTGKGGTPREEIAKTMEYLKNEGFSLIISLSNSRIARFVDPEIKAVWLETYGGEAFEHIPNEDHADNPHFKIGDGPSIEKLRRCISMAEPYLSEGKKVAIYCRGGTGRTGSYLSALLTSRELKPEEAIRKVGESMRKHSAGDMLGLTIELEANGGLEALKGLGS